MAAYTFTAPESLTDPARSTAKRYRDDLSRLTDEAVAALSSVSEAGPVKADRVTGNEAGPVRQIMDAAREWAGTDKADNLTTAQIAARTEARGTMLRAALPVVRDVWTRQEIASVFGLTPGRVTHVMHEVDRLPVYDALGLTVGEAPAWPMGRVQKASEKDWTAHVDALTATDEDEGEDVTGNGDETAPTAPTAPRDVTVADVLKSLEAAREALDSLTVAVDDTEAMEIAAALAAVQYAGEAYAV